LLSPASRRLALRRPAAPETTHGFEQTLDVGSLLRSGHRQPQPGRSHRHRGRPNRPDGNAATTEVFGELHGFGGLPDDPREDVTESAQIGPELDKPAAHLGR